MLIARSRAGSRTDNQPAVHADQDSNRQPPSSRCAPWEATGVHLDDIADRRRDETAGTTGARSSPARRRRVFTLGGTPALRFTLGGTPALRRRGSSASTAWRALGAVGSPRCRSASSAETNVSHSQSHGLAFFVLGCCDFCGGATTFRLGGATCFRVAPIPGSAMAAGGGPGSSTPRIRMTVAATTARTTRVPKK
jgi:hypothetical protein